VPSSRSLRGKVDMQRGERRRHHTVLLRSRPPAGYVQCSNIDLRTRRDSDLVMRPMSRLGLEASNGKGPCHVVRIVPNDAVNWRRWGPRIATTSGLGAIRVDHCLWFHTVKVNHRCYFSTLSNRSTRAAGPPVPIHATQAPANGILTLSEVPNSCTTDSARTGEANK
jgi:hypothetical protein